jgi:hypothetical protein
MLPQRFRSYQDTVFTVRGTGETVYRGDILSSDTYTRDYVESGYMYDRVNGAWMATQVDHGSPGRAARLKRKLYGQDLGSPMSSIKIVHDYPLGGTQAGNSPTSSIHRRYNGSIIAQPPPHVPYGPATEQVLLGLVDDDDDFTLFAKGGTAISNCKPASPEASLGTGLIELYREGIPRLLVDLDLKHASEIFRSYGSNYLNVEFGWKPLVADIQASAKALHNSVAILQDLDRNSGKSMRRRYSFPLEKTVEETAYSRLPWPTLSVNHWTQGGCVLRTTKTKKTWFSGEFVYYLPNLRTEGLRELQAKSRHLLGLDLTPETLWNIAPWSWLGDWFANTGDIIANLTAISSDHLVMNYGYLMQETVTEFKTIHTGVKTLGYGTVTPRIEGTTTVTRRVRRRASPYGFGLKQSDLTTRQWAILTALGLTRGNVGNV